SRPCRSRATNLLGDVLRARHASPRHGPAGALRREAGRQFSAVPALQWRPLVPGRGVPGDTAYTRHGARRTVTPRVGSVRSNRCDTPAPGPDALRPVAPAPAGRGAGLAPHLR